MSDQRQLFVKMVVSSWETYQSRVTKLVDTLSDEQLAEKTAPGRNSGIYLLGHLAAVSDAVIPLLGMGERSFPELDAIFVSNPEKPGSATPEPSKVREYWKTISATLDKHIARIPTEDWFNRHNAVSESDFLKEPHRNKLNLLINRTNHMSYHLGQLIYLSKK